MLVDAESARYATIARLVDTIWPSVDGVASASELGVVDALIEHVDGLPGDQRDVWTVNLERVAHEVGDPIAAALRCDADWADDVRRLTMRYLFGDPSEGHGANPDAATWSVLDHPGVVIAEPAARTPATMSDAADEVEALLVEIERRDAAVRSALLQGPLPRAVDVVVVGVGAVGSVILRLLADQGLSVLGVEAGPVLPSREYQPNEGRVAFYAEGAWSTKFGDERPTHVRSSDAAPRPAAYGLGRMVNAVGGSILHYGAWLRRYHPHHLEARAHLDRVSRVGIPDDASYEDWPCTYEDLEPHYDAIESMIGVAGDGSNPFTPRSGPLPMPPLRPFPAGSAFASATRDRDFHPYPIPVGMNSIPYAGRPATNYSAWSNALGSLDRSRWCPLDDILPEALARAEVDVVASARVVGIEADGPSGAVSAVRIRRGGEEHRVECRAAVLASYTIENVRLMYLSADRRRPHGLGNNSDQLGRHLMAKAGGGLVIGSFPGRSWHRAEGPASQAVAIDDLMAYDTIDRNLTATGLGVSLQTENQALPIQIAMEPTPVDVPMYGSRWREHLIHWDSRLPVTVGTEAPPRPTSRITIDRSAPSDAIGMPRARIEYDWSEHEREAARAGISIASEVLTAMGASQIHHRLHMGIVLTSHDLGGARMGTDPTTSVVDAAHECHDTPGLWVFGGCTFPSSPPLNPTLTILADTRRATSELIQALTR